MEQENLFKWRHYKPEIIVLGVRGYLRYALSYRDLEEMMVERGLHVDHTTIYRWVHRYVPELQKRVRAQLKPTNDSWRVDETYIKVRGQSLYLYRAVDSFGNTIDFVLSILRRQCAAEYFFRKALGQAHTVMPRVLNVDKNPAYPAAFKALHAGGELAQNCELRPVKYLNNIVEQVHRFIKRRVKPGLGFKSCRTAWRTIDGYEAMNQLRKGPVQGTSNGDIRGQKEFIARAFGLAA